MSSFSAVCGGVSLPFGDAQTSSSAHGNACPSVAPSGSMRRSCDETSSSTSSSSTSSCICSSTKEGSMLLRSCTRRKIDATCCGKRKLSSRSTPESNIIMSTSGSSLCESDRDSEDSRNRKRPRRGEDARRQKTRTTRPSWKRHPFSLPSSMTSTASTSSRQHPFGSWPSSCVRHYFTVLCALLPSLALMAHAFGCFSDYSMSWCNNHTEESCIHDYTISVSHFQRKLDAYYLENKRPPLMEAYFMTKTPRVYQKEVFLESDCAPPLIMAFLLVAEARLDFDPNAMAYYEYGLQQMDLVSADQRYLLEHTTTWPLQKAIDQIHKKEQRILALQQAREKDVIVVDFVMSHCKEKDLSWINKKLRGAMKDVVARLFIYEKCHQNTPTEEFADLFYEIYIVAVPDPSFVARGDECSAYLSHITYRYHELADYTLFIHSDPGDHMHLEFLQVVLKSIAIKAFDQHFMHLNGPRHVRTMTPCIQAIAERIFGHQLEGTVGPYCCAQFLVSRDRIYTRDREFYANMLTMVNGTLPYDLCTTSRVARSTHCYGMEFLWHVVWGEPGDPPLRQDDANLPTAFRLKFGVEHEKSEWNDVVLSPNVPKKIVTKQEWDGEKFVYLHGGPGSEERGDLDPRPEWTETYRTGDPLPPEAGTPTESKGEVEL
ncbi:unnamed protein product [Amoebophrya sp. A25]|nr:unnamed protein product [Amoebophrya sp. A25]|eukprot:GSA25T00004369001.1